MTPDDWITLEETLSNLRRKNRGDTDVAAPEGVALLQKKLSQTKDNDERVVILSLLAEECALNGLYELELTVRRQYVEEFPDQPSILADLAARLSEDEKHVPEARLLIQQAVNLAENSGRFVRYCLGNQARIALKTSDADLMGRTLKRLIEKSNVRYEEDIGWESDFVRNLPIGFIDPEIVERYLATKPSK